MKKTLKVLIEYNCKKGWLCPSCIKDALLEADKYVVEEYKFKKLTVKEIK